jgi:hypothetical protein
MNSEQSKYIADLLKIIAVAQFGYFGYRSLESPDHAAFYVSGVVFLILVVIGVAILGFGKDLK